MTAPFKGPKTGNRHYTLQHEMESYPHGNNNKHKSREKYVVNFGRTNAYMDSTVPYLQRTLNNM